MLSSSFIPVTIAPSLLTFSELITVAPVKVWLAALNGTNATYSIISFAAAADARTISEPLVTVMSPAASLTPLTHTSMYPTVYPAVAKVV